jgi:hypothetical protein
MLERRPDLDERPPLLLVGAAAGRERDREDERERDEQERACALALEPDDLGPPDQRSLAAVC